MTFLNSTGAHFRAHRVRFGLFYRYLGVEHRVDTLGGNLRAGQQHEHHQQHHERHDDLRGKRHEGSDGGIIGDALIDERRSYPIKSERQAVHDQHHHGGHQRHHPPRKQLGLRNIRIRRVEFGFLIPLGVISAHDADAHKVFTGNAVEFIGELLHTLKFGHHDDHDGNDADEEEHYGDDGRQVSCILVARIFRIAHTAVMGAATAILSSMMFATCTC